MAGFALALVLTCGIETALGLLLTREAGRGRTALIILAANLITNPAVNYLNLLSRGSRLYILETGCILAEWWIYRKYLGLTTGRSLMLSLVLNAVTYAAGIFLSPWLSRYWISI